MSLIKLLHNATKLYTYKTATITSSGGLLWKFKRDALRMFREFKTFEEFSRVIDEYIYYYNNKKVQKKTKWMLPTLYR